MRKNGMSSATNPAPTLKEGIPKKRILRACNQCRSHKARCDGKEICETCRRYNRACHYNTLPIVRANPAGRIRALQDSLLKARHHINDLQKQLPKVAAGEASQTTSAHSTLRAPHNAHIAGESRIDKATSTGPDLVEKLLRPLSHHDDIRSLARPSGNGEFSRKSPAGTKQFYTTLCQLPLHATMIGAVSAAFGGVFGLCNIIVEQDFYAAAQKLYDSHPMLYTQEHATFVPLFFSVIALGLIHCTRFYQDNEHEIDLEESQFYFAAASSKVNLAEGHLSLPNLQAGLSIVLYLINTSKPDLARHQINVITSSPTVRNFLHSQIRQGSQARPPATLLTIPDQLLWLICYLDMHISDLLGLHPLLDCSAAISTTMPVINMAAQNVALCRRSDHSFLSGVSLAMAVELERLLQRSDTGTTDRSSMPSDSMAASERTHRCSNSVQIDFVTWEHTFQCMFPDDDNNLGIALAHNELRMHYHLAQIVLLHGHLAYHSHSPATEDPAWPDHICKGRACVIAASNAILFTAARVERMQMNSLTWLSAYTVFISAVVLFMAVYFMEGDNVHMRDAIERTIQIATHVLRYKTYNASQGKNTYMDFLAVLAARLKIEIELPPTPSVPSSIDASFYTCESFGIGSSVRSTSAPIISRDITHSPLESWWQWPETETLTEEWGFD